MIIPENEPAGSDIISLVARDSDPGIDGMVRYSITSGNQLGMFTVEETTGRVSIRRPLDYEIEREYNLTVVARDLASRPRQTEANLKIIITDVNDNVPFFEDLEYSAQLQENLPPGTEVITMTATDLDSARFAVMEYSIEEEEMRQFFEMEPRTGLVRSLVSFDYEQRTEYVVVVAVRNPGAGPARTNSTRLTIHISGANEYQPRFQQPVFQFSVSESAPAGTAVGTIRAEDQDLGRDGQVKIFLGFR